MDGRRAQAAWRDRRDIYRAIFALACLAGGVAFSAFVPTGQRSVARNAIAPEPISDDEIYTGSILFMPYDGNDCRQNLLDNHTGRIWDNGVVACDAAMAQGSAAQGRFWSAARVDAIRDGFAKR